MLIGRRKKTDCLPRYRSVSLTAAYILKSLLVHTLFLEHGPPVYTLTCESDKSIYWTIDIKEKNMIRSKSVNDFLDFESREDFAVSKSRTSLSVPNAHRDQDFRRNSNISCETSSSYYSESNEHLITGNRCDSLTLPEILHVAVLGDRGVGKHTLLHHFRDTEDIWSDLTGDFFLLFQIPPLRLTRTHAL